MTSNNRISLLRQLPAVDEILRTPGVAALLLNYPRSLVVDSVRSVLEHKRNLILEQNEEPGSENAAENQHTLLEQLVQEVIKEVEGKVRPNLRRVINATGVVLHTNLGRALLSAGARDAVHRISTGYCNLELDLKTGKRGSRYSAVEEILTHLTGAEAALVVNNNAAAVLLALSTMARDKEVIVSRGQLVEIGGSFRIPEVMSQGGAKLIEVGATNKTYPEDYSRAVTPDTALLLHVHTSNYRIVGFARDITIEELVQLGREHGIPVMSDLGSGFLVNLEDYGLPREPSVQEVVTAGSDIVTFSGDKLLGGPQAGIIVGRREYIDRMKRNPLTRAVRIDKFTVAALEATLMEYIDKKTALNNIPTLKMLTLPMEELENRAKSLALLLRRQLSEHALVNIESAFSAVGGGSMPTANLKSRAVTIKPKGMSVEKLAEGLRQTEPALIGRVQDDLLFLDVRTIEEDQYPLIAGIITDVLGGKKG